MERTTIQRILCPVDFSDCSLRAWEYASSVAQRYHAALFAQHVAELWRHPSACFAITATDYEKFCTEMRRKDLQTLQQFVGDHAHPGVSPRCVVEDGMAADVILSFARREAIDLIVIGTHGMRGFHRWMLGSVTDAVLQRARVPVLAVHRSSGLRPGASSCIDLRNILFASDLSENSRRSLPYAISLADEYGAHLTVMHVLGGLSRLHRTRACASLERLIENKTAGGAAISTVVRTGALSREISRLACEQQADLVVMAAPDQPRSDAGLFSSTIYRVVQSGLCPVLTVPAVRHPGIPAHDVSAGVDAHSAVPVAR